MPMGNRIIKDIYEYSITKEFRPKIWSKFVSCLKDNDLLKPHDHLLLLTSANKSSLLLARLFIQLLKHSDFEFDIHFVLFVLFFLYNLSLLLPLLLSQMR